MSGWRRIALFPLTRLLVWGLIMIGLSLLLSRLPVGPLLRQASTAIASLAALWFVGRVVERRRPAEYGLGVKGAPTHLLLGFIIAAVMMSITIGIFAVLGWYKLYRFTFTPAVFGLSLYTFFLIAIVEEVALRGLFFRVLEESLGSWISLTASALFFGLLHLANPNASPVAALAIAVEAGLLLGAAYMLTRSLWFAVGIHWGWNFFEGPVFGTPVSGGQFPAMGKAVVTGPPLMTGGAFGPEAGLVCLVIGTAVGIIMLRMAIRRGRVVRPVWRRRETEPLA